MALGVAWAPLGAGSSAPAPLRGGGTSDEIRRSEEAPGVPLSLGPREPSGTQAPGPLPSGAMSALPNPLYHLKEPFALQGPPSAWVDPVDVRGSMEAHLWREKCGLVWGGSCWVIRAGNYLVSLHPLDSGKPPKALRPSPPPFGPLSRAPSTIQSPLLAFQPPGPPPPSRLSLQPSGSPPPPSRVPILCGFLTPQGTLSAP